MSSARHLHRETILRICSGTSANPSGSPPDKSLGKHLAGSKCYATWVIFGPVNTMLYRLILIPSCWFVWGNKVSTAQCQLFCSLWVYFNRRVHDKHAHTTLWRDFSSACQLWVTRTQCPVAWYKNVCACALIDKTIYMYMYKYCNTVVVLSGIITILRFLSNFKHHAYMICIQCNCKMWLILSTCTTVHVHTCTLAT